MATISLVKALELYEEIGDHEGILKVKLVQLIDKFRDNTLKEVLPDVDTLIKMAIENKDPFRLMDIHMRMVHQAWEEREYEIMANYLETTEKLLIQNKNHPNYWAFELEIVKSKANLSRINKEYQKSKTLYHQALEICEQRSSQWVEVSILISLTELEREWGHIKKAKKYIETALEKGNTYQLDELLNEAFQVKSEIAEAEGQFLIAFDALKKGRFHEDKFKERGAGFNIENYYLTQEKKQLATEKENKELELQLKNSQLENSIAIIALALFLVLALVLAFANQRKSKKELSSVRKFAREEQLKETADTSVESANHRKEVVQQWLDELEKQVRQNIDKINFTIDDLATDMLISKRQLYRQINLHIGETPHQYLKSFRLNYARNLLENSQVDSVKAAAYSVGFPNTVYFTRQFKKSFGRLPSTYL